MQVPSPDVAFYCQWEPTEDGSELRWDGGEKFYGYVGWLKLMIDNFFKPWGRVLSGTVGAARCRRPARLPRAQTGCWVASAAAPRAGHAKPDLTDATLLPTCTRRSQVTWQGDNREDKGKIQVRDNQVTVECSDPQSARM